MPQVAGATRIRHTTRVLPRPLPEAQFDVVIGVDQTGAIAERGASARPLSVAVGLRGDAGKWTIKAGQKGALKLASLARGDVENLLAQVRAKVPLSRVALMLDCVLGLPESVMPEDGADALWRVMTSSAQGDEDGVRFGMARAQKFFDALLPPTESLPQRACEVLCGAVSVFQTRPFQKNVQTGTYRIWRDLTSTQPRWVNLWPFESEPMPDAPWAFEAFPSWMWRNKLGVRTRDRSMLKLAVKMAGKRAGLTFSVDNWELLEADANAADAAVLCVGAAILQEERRLMVPFEGFQAHPCRRKEGWIAGLTPETVKVATAGGGE